MSKKNSFKFDYSYGGVELMAETNKYIVPIVILVIGLLLGFYLGSSGILGQALFGSITPVPINGKLIPGGKLKEPISVNSPPIANFNYSPIKPVREEEVTFSSTSSDPDGRIVYYKWCFFPSDCVEGSDLTEVSYTYGLGGTYHVTLTVKDDDGAINSITKNFGVSPDYPQEIYLDITTYTQGTFTLENQTFYYRTNTTDLNGFDGNFQIATVQFSQATSTDYISPGTGGNTWYYKDQVRSDQDGWGPDYMTLTGEGMNDKKAYYYYRAYEAHNQIVLTLKGWSD